MNCTDLAKGGFGEQHPETACLLARAEQVLLVRKNGFEIPLERGIGLCEILRFRSVIRSHGGADGEGGKWLRLIPACIS